MVESELIGRVFAKKTKSFFQNFFISHESLMKLVRTVKIVLQ